MRRCFIIMVFWIWLLPVYAATATSEEMNSLRQWISDRFGKDKKAAAPFSFVFDGKPSAEFLESWERTVAFKKLDDRRSEYVLIFKDPQNDLLVRCIGIAYNDFSAMEWVLQFQNTGGQDTPVIEQIKALDLEIKTDEFSAFTLHHSLGEYNSAASFAPLETIIQKDSIVTLSPRGGRSSDGHMPFFNLAYGDRGLLLALGWSGQWEATYRHSPAGTLRIQAGMQQTHFRLYPGEIVRSPRILLLFWEGHEPLRGNNLFRQLLIAHYLLKREGKVVIAPICASVTEVDPGGSYEGPHLRAMPLLAARGVEVFWSDMDPQQWYPVGFPDGTGTWEPDTIKYPQGLQPIGEAAHAAGLQYLLWFEPERVAPGSRIDREHPEWVMKRKGEKHGLFRLNDTEARNWLIDYIDLQISQAQLDWLRYDFNIEPLEFWRQNDTPDRQGITEIRYIEGLYALWDELRLRHPGLVVDLCASGGRRNDLEALMRGIPLWHSDMQCFGPNPSAEQLQNGGLFRWIPFHGAGNFDYEPGYRFRSAMTTGNIFVSPAIDKIMQYHREKEKEKLQTNGLTIGPWYFCGPFHKTAVDPFDEVFEPEKAVNSGQSYENNNLEWTEKSDWLSGQIHHFPARDSSASYLYRTFTAKRNVSFPIYLGSDDGIRVFLNGQSIYENNVSRPVAEQSDSVFLNLKKGENRLLLKIINTLKRSGFYFSALAIDYRRRILDAVLPESEEAVKRSVAIYQKVRPFMMGDFYPLFPHDPSEKVWYGYQFHRADLNAGIAIVFRRKESQESRKQILLQDLHPQKHYRALLETANTEMEFDGKSGLEIKIKEVPGSEIIFYQE